MIAGGFEFLTQFPCYVLGYSVEGLSRPKCFVVQVDGKTTLVAFTDVPALEEFAEFHGVDQVKYKTIVIPEPEDLDILLQMISDSVGFRVGVLFDPSRRFPGHYIPPENLPAE